jgi:hypothetical protein
MRIATMKPTTETKGHFWHATMAHGPSHHSFDDSWETFAAAAMWVVGIALVVMLWAAMFAGLYHWIHYAPLFSPDDASSLAPITEMTHISQGATAAWVDLSIGRGV